ARAALQREMCRLADGDRAAFEPVFAALWPVLRAFAARALPVPAEAEDAAQCALIKVFSRAAEFDASREALPWALGIAAYECRTLRKARSRRREELRAPPEPADERTAEDAAIERDLAAGADRVALRRACSAGRCPCFPRRRVGPGGHGWAGGGQRRHAAAARADDRRMLDVRPRVDAFLRARLRRRWRRGGRRACAAGRA